MANSVRMVIALTGLFYFRECLACYSSSKIFVICGEVMKTDYKFTGKYTGEVMNPLKAGRN